MLFVELDSASGRTLVNLEQVRSIKSHGGGALLITFRGKVDDYKVGRYRADEEVFTGISYDVLIGLLTAKGYIVTLGEISEMEKMLKGV